MQFVTDALNEFADIGSMLMNLAGVYKSEDGIDSVISLWKYNVQPLFAKVFTVLTHLSANV